MLYKSLHFKLVLIFVIFIVLVISIVGVIMLNLVFDFYTDDFVATMHRTLLNEEILQELKSVMSEPNFYEEQKEILRVQHGNLSINEYRNLYILDMTGRFLVGTTDESDIRLIITRNILEAMNGNIGDSQSFGDDYMDFAMPLRYGGNEAIIYIIDTQEQMREFSERTFEIIIQALLLGLIIAITLSFFSAKAITSPIQRITRAASALADGDFERKIEIISRDEIGTLAETFNDMAEKLESTLNDVSSEREKLETIFLYLQDGVLLFSSDGTLRSMNPEAGEILKGFDYNNTLDDFLRILDLGERDENSENNEGNESEENVKSSKAVVYRDVTCDERTFDVNIGALRYMEDNREAIGTIAVMQDITQRYSLEKSRREFVANVSHELKTPLSSIRGAAESVFERESMNAETKAHYLSMILEESDKMSSIISRLLFASSVENRKMMWNFETVDIEAIARKVYENMQSAAEKKNQTLTLTVNGEIPPISADRHYIENDVLVNIISNAIKYTQEGGEIEFTLSACEMQNGFAGVRLVIKDNGYGIPKEDLPHIFERFYRVDKARSADAGGTGLGLSIAQQVVHEHKGQITLDSTLGFGTSVTIILPCETDEVD